MTAESRFAGCIRQLLLRSRLLRQVSPSTITTDSTRSSDEKSCPGSVPGTRQTALRGEPEQQAHYQKKRSRTWIL